MKCYYCFEDKWYEGHIGNFHGMTSIILSSHSGHSSHNVVFSHAQISFMSDYLNVTGYILSKEKDNIYKLDSCEVAFDKRVAQRLGMNNG